MWRSVAGLFKIKVHPESFLSWWPLTQDQSGVVSCPWAGSRAVIWLHCRRTKLLFKNHCLLEGLDPSKHRKQEKLATTETNLSKKSSSRFTIKSVVDDTGSVLSWPTPPLGGINSGWHVILTTDQPPYSVCLAAPRTDKPASQRVFAELNCTRCTRSPSQHG